MDPISNADRLAALLRQRLLDRARAAGSAQAKEKAGQGAVVDRVYAAGGVEPRDERQLRRTLIQTILADEFGSELLNEAGFHQVVDRVLDAIEGDAAAAALLDRVTSEASAGG